MIFLQDLVLISQDFTCDHAKILARFSSFIFNENIIFVQELVLISQDLTEDHAKILKDLDIIFCRQKYKI
jgi:hypothetical protein